MKIAIMQPYFFPYIGYFQLIGAVDTFVLYDNIKYTKKGWINRNRLLSNSGDAIFSIPIVKGSDSLDVVEREISESFNREKLLNRFKGAYAKAPYFDQTWQLLEASIRHSDNNLFRYIKNSLILCLKHLEIDTKIVLSSEVTVDHSLRSADRVIAICKKLHATSYANPIGGKELYTKQAFHEAGLSLFFLQSHSLSYAQFTQQFVPWLSIIDVLMFNGIERTRLLVMHSYDLI
jgi:hypothetical protein